MTNPLRSLALLALLPTLLAALPASASAQDALPELPAFAGREGRWVQTLERVARGTLGCIAFEGERGGEEYDDPRCWDWYDRLQTAGRAGVHATGRVLLASLAQDERGAAPPESLPRAQARLIQILGSAERAEAVPYLVHALALARGPQPRHVELAVEILDALDRVSGQDVTPLPAWESPHQALRERTRRADLASRWARWYADHAATPRRAWREEGLEQARARLGATDPVERFAAIRRLDDRGRAHFALADALRELIARPDLDPAARRYVTRYALRHGLLQRDDVRAILSAS